MSIAAQKCQEELWLLNEWRLKTNGGRGRCHNLIKTPRKFSLSTQLIVASYELRAESFKLINGQDLKRPPVEWACRKGETGVAK